MAKLYVVGIGPGGVCHMTERAIEVIKTCKVVVGYTFYIELIKDFINDKEVIKTGMRGEIERCKMAIGKVKAGFDTCIISTGDAGLYGMAGPIYEMAEDIEIEVVPGVTAVFSAASELGAPIMHDFCTISLSDLMTPWEVIEKRIRCAAEGDFIIAIYNPKSKGRVDYINKAVDIILKYRAGKTPVGIVKNSGREGNAKIVTTLENINFDFIDMMSVVIVGNSNSYLKNNFIVTPRGYKL